MEHKHIYDAAGTQLCCLREEKILTQAGATELVGKTIPQPKAQHHEHHHAHDHSHDHAHAHESTPQLFFPAILSGVLLAIGILCDHVWQPSWFVGYVRLGTYLIAYFPVGFPVLKEALEGFKKGELFSEFFLMSIATLGAFAIGEYPEAVTVMLFYAIGEAFQTIAVKKSTQHIKSLLDQRPDTVTLLQDNQAQIIPAASAAIGAILQLKPGEKLGLDGILLSPSASFNTAALTGESLPVSKTEGEEVLAGMINGSTLALVKVTTAYQDSKLSKILTLVQQAASQKAPTELFIRKFARIYTPIIVALSVAICILPYFVVPHYQFQDWLYRALIFLVISCPCALVISIPLGYFGGIGAASKKGILVKGGNFLDLLATVQHIVVDKTGTITQGIFAVQEVQLDPRYESAEILSLVNRLESHSTHPIAAAIHQYVGAVNPTLLLTHVEEIAGHGLRAVYQGKELLVGNLKLMDRFQISYSPPDNAQHSTLVAIAYDKLYVGYISIADPIKPEAAKVVQTLHRMGINATMLSGDRSSVVAQVARTVGIQAAYGDLLPDDKVEKVQQLKQNHPTIAFVGDGINDAPVIALSDVGIAMGGLGSDAAIETADVVIQDDNLQKIPIAIQIGKQTKKLVWQNILFAFGVKALVLLLGAGGLATMWEAVFADVGVALLAIFNTIRIQHMTFRAD